MLLHGNLALFPNHTNQRSKNMIEIKKANTAITINVQILTTTAIVPTKSHKGDAGYDLYADIDYPVTIEPHTTEMISTGIAVQIPEGYFGGIFARSGLASKQSLRPANCVGVIDSPYRGECVVALHNDADIPRTINPCDRIAQLIVMPYLDFEFNEVSELSDTDRGEGGFGSTGR